VAPGLCLGSLRHSSPRLWAGCAAEQRLGDPFGVPVGVLLGQGVLAQDVLAKCGERERHGSRRQDEQKERILVEPATIRSPAFFYRSTLK
jgi:hypothetical protein